MENQPWHFDRYGLFLSEMEGDKAPSEVTPYFLPLWTRFYDLPFKGRCNRVNVASLGNKIGTFMCLDPIEDIDIEKSVRIRVLLDVRKPLNDKINLNLWGGVVKADQR